MAEPMDEDTSSISGEGVKTPSSDESFERLDELWEERAELLGMLHREPACLLRLLNLNRWYLLVLALPPESAGRGSALS